MLHVHLNNVNMSKENDSSFHNQKKKKKKESKKKYASIKLFL